MAIFRKQITKLAQAEEFNRTQQILSEQESLTI